MTPGRFRGSDRRGFTLIELMISAVVGALILMVLYQVLFLNQRSFTVQSEQIRQRQTLRATLDVMVSHLSELSGKGGDIIAGGPDSIRVRAVTAFGIVCGGTLTGLRVERQGDVVMPNDSILIFAEHSIFDHSDDQWLKAQVNGTDTVAVCPNGAEAYDIEVPGITVGPVVRVGAPIRAFEPVTFNLSALNNEWFLSRSGPSGPEPLVGPLATPMNEGLTIEYLDSLNVPVADPRNADQIVVTARTESNVLGLDRIPLSDSARARVSLKN